MSRQAPRPTPITTTYPHRQYSPILTPGLSSRHHQHQYTHPTTPRYTYTTPATTPQRHSTPQRYTTTTQSSRSYSYPTTPRETREKGLSYTSTRDLGGWLGGAALTAGAAYLLRGGNGGGRREETGRGREGTRESGRGYHEDRYVRARCDEYGYSGGRHRGRRSERRDYGGASGEDVYRGKSERRRDGEREREKGRERDRRYYRWGD